jgi:hypothetical protein
MKKLLLTAAIAVFTLSSVNAQDSKFYLGIGVGYASAGGDFDEHDGGIAFDFFDMGYRFNESWGVTLGLNSAGHAFDDDGVTGATGVATFAIGPMYSFPAGNMRWDFKPQYAFSMAAVQDIDGGGEFEATGSAFILGNSLVIGDGSWQWSIDADYVMGNFDEYEGEKADFDYNSFRIGFGLRYNF